MARDETGPLATLTADGEDRDEAGRGHIRIVMAEKRAQGRGLVHRLLADGLANLRAAGLPGAWLDAFAGLHAARRVYEKPVSASKAKPWETPGERSSSNNGLS